MLTLTQLISCVNQNNPFKVITQIEIVLPKLCHQMRLFQWFRKRFKDSAKILENKNLKNCQNFKDLLWMDYGSSSSYYLRTVTSGQLLKPCSVTASDRFQNFFFMLISLLNYKIILTKRHTIIIISERLSHYPPNKPIVASHSKT